MDEPSWSQRKAFNNDGMDPDWKPDLVPIETVGRKLDALVRAAKVIASIPFKDDDFKANDWIKIKIPASYLIDLKQALKELENK